MKNFSFLEDFDGKAKYNHTKLLDDEEYFEKISRKYRKKLKKLPKLMKKLAKKNCPFYN